MTTKTNRWLVVEPGGGVKYFYAENQEEALVKALKAGIVPSSTNMVRPQEGKDKDAELMSEREFQRKKEKLTGG